jgi:hypothetical protein
MIPPDKPFFVGYLPVPGPLRVFLLTVGAGLIALFAVLGIVLASAADDPGPGAFRFDYGRQVLTGVIETDPYPLLHVTQGTDRVAEGRTLMLSGGGKFGVTDRAAPLAGQLVQVTGVILERGTLDMLQVGGAGDAMVAVDGPVPPIESEPLGTWRLAGEICDGKCLAGAMRPGRGLAHKACANLCLIGEVPPVFVSTQPVAASEFLLIGAQGGGMLPPQLLDHVGSYVSLEGDIERQGDLLVFRVLPDSVKVLP